MLFVVYELFDFCNSSGRELNCTENVNANICPSTNFLRVNMELTDIFSRRVFCIFSGLHIRHLLRKMSVIYKIRFTIRIFFCRF